MQQEQYLQYKDKFKKINLVTIILIALIILAYVGLVFLPLFNATYTKKITVEDFNGDINAYMEFISSMPESDLELALKGEIEVKESFSLFSAFMDTTKFFEGGLNFSSMKQLIPFLNIVVIALFMFNNLMQIINYVRVLIPEIEGVLHPENYYKLQYEFNKKMTATDMANKSGSGIAISIIIMFAISLGWLYLLKFLNPMLAGEDAFIGSAFSMSGITGWIILFAIMVVAIIVLNNIMNKTRKNLVLEIGNEKEN